MQNLGDVVRYILGFVNLLLPIVGALALLAFFKGLIGFIRNSGDTKAHQDGKNLMIWGVIALFIMVSFLGIITIVKRDLGLSSRTGIPYIRR